MLDWGGPWQPPNRLRSGSQNPMLVVKTASPLRESHQLRSKPPLRPRQMPNLPGGLLQTNRLGSHKHTWYKVLLLICCFRLRLGSLCRDLATTKENCQPASWPDLQEASQSQLGASAKAPINITNNTWRKLPLLLCSFRLKPIRPWPLCLDFGGEKENCQSAWRAAIQEAF